MYYPLITEAEAKSPPNWLFKIQFTYAAYAYMTFDDIKQICAETNDTLIAVRAPIGTKIEIPDPD